jgi:HK97 family phage prohead protease
VVYELGGMLERIVPGAFDTTRFDVCAVFDHDDRPGRRFGWTRDKSLSVWQDRTGLAFELTMPSSSNALGLIRGIKSGVCRACSFRCGDVDGIVSEIVVERGHPVRVIKRIAVDEVSVAPAGANPAAGCWLSDEPLDGMPDHARQARSLWAAGRPQAQSPLAPPAPVRRLRRGSSRVRRPPCWPRSTGSSRTLGHASLGGADEPAASSPCRSRFGGALIQLTDGPGAAGPRG